MDRLLREGNPPTGQLASPKPQYKDVQTNNWEELRGEGGASYVKDKDVFAKLEQARALLDAISGKDFATQTTLAAVLAKLADLESKLATIKANQLSGDQKVQLSGASGNIISPATEDKLEQVRQLLAGVATEAKLEQARGLLAGIFEKDFATQATLAQVQSELALVKAELQEIKANQLSGDQKVQLSGTIMALDPETGKPQPITLVKDPDSGLFYLGTAQVGHVGYDEFNDSYKVDVYNKTELLAYHEVSFIVSAVWTLSDTAERWSTSSSKPLDVRKYNKLFFVFQNNHDTGSVIMQICFYDTLDPVAWRDVETKSLYIVNEKTRLDVTNPENYIWIPPGKVVFASEKEYPELAYPGIGMIMRVRRNVTPSEGSVKVWVFGK